MPAYQVTDSPVLTHPGSAGRDLAIELVPNKIHEQFRVYYSAADVEEIKAPRRHGLIDPTLVISVHRLGQIKYELQLQH
ncbi:hypothetical protein SLE2022_329850 [Rubroshorea leprosula]